MNLRDKYNSAIQVAKGLHMEGSAQERDGKLYFTGLTKSQDEVNKIWDAIKTVPDWRNDIIADIKVDRPYLVPDEEGIPLIFELLAHEGLCTGGSTGINIAGAIRLAKDLGPGHTIVTVLADYGTRYQSRLFNPAFLRSKGLPVPEWLESRRADIPDVRVG